MNGVEVDRGEIRAESIRYNNFGIIVILHKGAPKSGDRLFLAGDQEKYCQKG
jgi:hypothetical protein